MLFRSGYRKTIIENGDIDISCTTPMIPFGASVGDESVSFLNMSIADQNGVKDGWNLLNISGYYYIDTTSGEMTSGHISIGASADGNFQMMEIPIHFTDPVKFDSPIISDIMMRDKSIKFPNLAGDEMVTILRGGSQSLKISNENGYLEVGPMNTSYAHVYTDRPSFYFNKGILVNGTAVSLSNHTHTTFDRASAVLSGANVFSNFVVTDGIVTSIATRAMIAADVGAAAESHTH